SVGGRGPGGDGGAGTRSGADGPQGAGGVEEPGGDAGEPRQHPLSEGVQHAACHGGARARVPAAHDQEGELLHRRQRRPGRADAGPMIPGEGMTAPARPQRTVLDMNGYQWTVLLAAWLGWGFDVFDGLLFNFVAPNAVPTLLGLHIRDAAREGG